MVIRTATVEARWMKKHVAVAEAAARERIAGEAPVMATEAESLSWVSEAVHP
jgi:hypothetical protein